MNRSPIKIYIRVISLLLALTTLAFFLILGKLDPFAHSRNVIIFHLNLFVLSLSLSTLAGYYLRQKAGQREFAGLYFAVSIRQGLWFAILLLVSLILQSYGLFTILNAIFLVLALICLEGYFLYNK